MKPYTYDLLGNIAILKFKEPVKRSEKKQLAKEFLQQNNHTQTVLEKSSKVKGRLRIAKTKFLAGKNTRETTYTENGCKFKFNVDETYFSPRLSNHRSEIAEEIVKLTKPNTRILVMFAGVAPLPIVIAKKLKLANKLDNIQIISEEINKKASKYAKENVILNKLQDNIQVIQCDAKKLSKKLKNYNAERITDKFKGRLNFKGNLVPLRYDIILMPRPQLKETFLSVALKLSKKGTLIYYHGFGKSEKEIKQEITKETKGKISNIKVQQAGNIAPYKFRYLARFKVK